MWLHKHEAMSLSKIEHPAYLYWTYGVRQRAGEHCSLLLTGVDPTPGPHLITEAGKGRRNFHGDLPDGKWTPTIHPSVVSMTAQVSILSGLCRLLASVALPEREPTQLLASHHPPSPPVSFGGGTK